MFTTNHLNINRLTKSLAPSKRSLLIPVLVACCLASANAITEESNDSRDNRHSILVIANDSSGQDSITASTLRSIFAMRNRRWGQEDRVEVFVLPDDHPTHVSFAKMILHTFPYNLRRIWDRRVYSGTGKLPNLVSSEEEMIEKVSNTPNSIGYITESYYRESAKIVELKR